MSPPPCGNASRAAGATRLTRRSAATTTAGPWRAGAWPSPWPVSTMTVGTEACLSTPPATRPAVGFGLRAAHGARSSLPAPAPAHPHACKCSVGTCASTGCVRAGCSTPRRSRAFSVPASTSCAAKDSERHHLSLYPALVLPALGQLPSIEMVSISPPGANEVLVRVMAAGVCHTDLAAVRDARACPLVLGHEGAGVLESVGDGVVSPRPGDIPLRWLYHVRGLRGSLHRMS
jgi:hypothetical protein